MPPVCSCGNFAGMSGVHRTQSTPRLVESSVAWCLLLSVCLHLVGTGAYLWLKTVAISRPDVLPAWLLGVVMPKAPPAPLNPDPKELEPKVPEEQQDPMVTFVEVDPAAVTDQTPPKTPLYSTANTLAANVKQPEKITDKPKIEGEQEKIIRTFRNDKIRPFQPALPPEPESPPTPVEVPKAVEVAAAVEALASKPIEGPKVGQVAFAKPVPMAAVNKPSESTRPPPNKPTTENGSAKASTEAATPRPARPPRPRSLAEARANKGMLVGDTMKQDGGVPRVAGVPSLDVQASPFGIYDAAMIYAVQQAWYSLLDESRFTYERSGKVVLRFTLRADGSVSNMKTLESEVGDTLAFLCETAVIKPQPYAKWPAEMRREVGSEFREITFTFHYN